MTGPLLLDLDAMGEILGVDFLVGDRGRFEGNEFLVGVGFSPMLLRCEATGVDFLFGDKLIFRAGLIFVGVVEALFLGFGNRGPAEYLVVRPLEAEYGRAGEIGVSSDHLAGLLADDAPRCRTDGSGRLFLLLLILSYFSL